MAIFFRYLIRVDDDGSLCNGVDDDDGRGVMMLMMMMMSIVDPDR